MARPAWLVGPSPGAHCGLQAGRTERSSGGDRRSSRTRGACVTAHTGEVHPGESSVGREGKFRGAGLAGEGCIL